MLEKTWKMCIKTRISQIPNSMSPWNISSTHSRIWIWMELWSLRSVSLWRRLRLLDSLNPRIWRSNGINKSCFYLWHSEDQKTLKGRTWKMPIRFNRWTLWYDRISSCFYTQITECRRKDHSNWCFLNLCERILLILNHLNLLQQLLQVWLRMFLPPTLNNLQIQLWRLLILQIAQLWHLKSHPPDPNRRMIIDGIGGEAKIEKLVKIIIDRIYADARTNTFFAGIDQLKWKSTWSYSWFNSQEEWKILRVKIWETHIRTIKSMMSTSTSSWIISAIDSSKGLLSQQCIMSSAGFLRVSESKLSRLNFPFTIDSVVNLP